MINDNKPLNATEKKTNLVMSVLVVVLLYWKIFGPLPPCLARLGGRSSSFTPGCPASVGAYPHGCFNVNSGPAITQQQHAHDLPYDILCTRRSER